MKKILLMTACIAMLCSCSKTDPPADENVMQTKVAPLEQVTITLQVWFANDPNFGVNSTTPYGCQVACEQVGRYGIEYVTFNIRDVYVKCADHPDYHPDTGLEQIRDGYSSYMPLIRTHDTYMDANSLSVYPESSEYNFTFKVIGLPVRAYTPGGGGSGGGGGDTGGGIDSNLRAAYPPVI